MKKLAIVIALCLLFASAVSADDLLYASDGKQLFTVDLQTGALTFQSDGPLQWIASPAFDEEHHTTFWLGDCCANHQGTYVYGNPFTGQAAGPYKASASYSDSWLMNSGEAGANTNSSGLLVYNPITQRLYTFSSWYGSGDQVETMIMMVDQYNGPFIYDWGGVSSLNDFRWDYSHVASMAFDPTTSRVLLGVNGTSSYALDNGCGVTGVFSRLPTEAAGQSIRLPRIGPFAVQPITGDVFYVCSESDWYPAGNNQTLTLRRWDRANSQDFEICILDAPLQLRFADAKYVQP